MTDSLGLSIGTTDLVAARAGAVPVTRRAVLILFPNRAPEVGLPSENPNLTEPGVVLSGFVERVGDPVPLFAPDGSSHQADRLLVEALDAMGRTVGDGSPPSQVAIAVPAHWGPAVLGALRAVLRTKPNLSPHGVPPALISDALAALAALNTSPGLPPAGSSRCSISAAAAPASRSPTRPPIFGPSTRPSATPSFPAPRSIRHCSPTCSRTPASPAASTRQAPSQSVRSPDYATNPGRRKSSCPPRPQPS